MKVKELIPVRRQWVQPTRGTTGEAETDSARTSTHLNKCVGDRDVCAWQPTAGITWVQTRNPEHARRLARRRDGRLVAYAVVGGFLRTFEFTRPLSWAIRLMARYKANERGTNAASGRAICPKPNLSVSRRCP